jgi:hypothetical protein
MLLIRAAWPRGRELNTRRIRNRNLVSLTPMIIGVAFTVAIIAILAWTVLPSSGSENEAPNRPDGEEITAPEFALEDTDSTATTELTDEGRINRVDEPLVLDPTSTPTATAIDTAVPTPTTARVDLGDETPRVISPPTAIVQPTLYSPDPTRAAPTRVAPTRVPPTVVATSPPVPTVTRSATSTATVTPQPTIVLSTPTSAPPTVIATDTPLPTAPPLTATPTASATVAIPTETPTKTATPSTETRTPSPDTTETETPEPTGTPDGTGTPRATRTPTQPDASPDVAKLD